MPVEVILDQVLARRRVRSKDLAAHVGITEANLSLLKQGRVKGVRFETLGRICAYLDCQPGDILRYLPDSGARRGTDADGGGEAGDEADAGGAPAADAAD